MVASYGVETASITNNDATGIGGGIQSSAEEKPFAMEQPDNIVDSGSSGSGNARRDAQFRPGALSGTTRRILAVVGGVLTYANLALQGKEGLCSLPKRGWPLDYYSNFYGHESYHWSSLLVDMAIAALMLVAAGWVVETWSRRRFRIGLPTYVGLTCVAGILAVGIYAGIVSFCGRAAPGENGEVALYFNAISDSILGRRLDFRIYGDDAWEYIPYSVLFLGIGCIVYATGKVLLFPFRILTPSPFRLRTFRHRA